MQKRLLLIIGGVLVAAIITGGVLLASKKGGLEPSITLQNVNPANPTQTPIPQSKLMTWDDPAGFTFQYPEGLLVNKHEEDNDSYAHVELTSKDHPGSLIVWAKDTKSADVTAWARTEKSFAGVPILDTTLGGEAAKKIMMVGPEKLVTGTISDDILFELETTLADKPYWINTHNIVATSFAFTPAPQGGGNTSGASDEAVDETETVQ